MSESSQDFQQLVHATVEHMLAPRRDGGPVVAVPTEQVLGMCGAGAATWPAEQWRWRGHEAARQVAAYLAYLQPPAGWQVGGELGDDACLLWRHEGTVLADVLATGGRGRALWTPRTSGLPRRLVHAGRERFGDGFVGVRVLALAAAGASLLVTDPTGPPTPLMETTWTFWPHTVSAGHRLVVAAAGEVS